MRRGYDDGAEGEQTFPDHDTEITSNAGSHRSRQDETRQLRLLPMRRVRPPSQGMHGGSHQTPLHHMQTNGSCGRCVSRNVPLDQSLPRTEPKRQRQPRPPPEWGQPQYQGTHARKQWSQPQDNYARTIDTGDTPYRRDHCLSHPRGRRSPDQTPRIPEGTRVCPLYIPGQRNGTPNDTSGHVVR